MLTVPWARSYKRPSRRVSYSRASDRKSGPWGDTSTPRAGPSPSCASSLQRREQPPGRPGGSSSRPSPRGAPPGRSAAKNGSPVGPGRRRPSPSRWEPPRPQLLCPSRTTVPRRSGPSGPRCWPRRGRPLSMGPWATSRYYRWTVCRTRRAGNRSPRGAGARSCTPFTRGRGAGAVPLRRAPRCLHGREPSSRTRTAPRGYPVAGRLHRVAADGAEHPRRGPRPVGGGPARSVATSGTGCGSAPPNLQRCGPTDARCARQSRHTATGGDQRRRHP